MDGTLPVEPSCYIFVDTDANNRSFNGCFWPTFCSVEAFVDLNELCIPITADLRKAVADLFPFRARTQLPSRQDPAKLIIRFLDRRAILPLFDYSGVEDCVGEECFQKTGGAYSSDDVWLAWRDLLAQLVMNAVRQRMSYVPIVLACAEWSCLPDPPCLELRPTGENRLKLRGYRASAAEWPAGFVAPEPYFALMKRRRSGEPKITWEDSGHLPPLSIKRALTRTACDVSWLVSRVTTTYRVEDASDACKLQPGSTFADLVFRISDGHVIFKGVFTTIAATQAEQAVATQLLSRTFMNRCEQERFVLA